MKILMVILIMMASFLIGSGVKQKYQNEYQFIIYLKNFTIYLKSNFNMFKNDIVSIIEDYIKMQNDSKYNQILEKENEIYIVNQKVIRENISREEDVNTIFAFLTSLGQNNYEFENEKISSFIKFLEIKTKEYFEKIKTKGVLTEKILISVGLVISILVW